MESWTSIWTVSPEVDLVSFDGAMVIFRVNGLPKKSNVAKSREAYEQFYGTKEYWGGGIMKNTWLPVWYRALPSEDLKQNSTN